MTQEILDKAKEYEASRERFKAYLVNLEILRNKTTSALEKGLKHLCFPGISLERGDDLFRTSLGMDSRRSYGSYNRGIAGDYEELVQELGWFNPGGGLIMSLLDDLEKAIQKKIEYYDNKIKEL